MSEQNLITIALIIIFILYLLSYNLYINFNYHNGSSIGFKDTVKNIFNLLPEFDFKFDINNKEAINNGEDINNSEDIDIETPLKNEERERDTKPLIHKRKKEVFNIDSNDFTYDEAPLVCKSLGSSLATYNQVINAHKEGANWCNYGWSANQLALYPIQKDTWEKLQEGPKNLRKMCGKPGVNGGYFNNKNLKFGVNCYGYKKTPDPSKIIYQEEKSNKNDSKNTQKSINNIKKNLDIRPFNTNKWSRYSYKKSSYIINPDYIDPAINNPTQIIDTIDDNKKDPQSINNIPSEEESN